MHSMIAGRNDSSLDAAAPWHMSTCNITELSGVMMIAMRCLTAPSNNVLEVASLGARQCALSNRHGA